ncbi:MAG TPA: M56 family metallopeptidase, partial [Lacipirellulaceae bacterium]|nr:M56 family metallopeptidase [Lacipirellulaceae bacterium]
MALNVENFLSFAMDVSLKALLLACVAGAALLVFRVRNANLRHRVWLAVLTGMLVLPFCVGRIPGLRIHLGLIAREVPCEVVPAAMPVPEMGPTPAVEPAFVEGAPPVAGQMAESLDISGPAPVAQNNTPETKRWLPSISIPQLIFTAYLLGVAWFVTRLAVGARQAHRLIWHAKRIELSARDRQLVGSTEVRESAMIRVPLSLGWWRGMILLPSDWQSWNESMLQAALLHEKEHVARRDQRVALLAELNRAVYWFHPVAWFLRRRLSSLAEAACDDAVIASTDDPAGYARNLLAIAGRLADRPWRLGPAVVAMARTPRIEQRIEAVLDQSRPLARRLSYGTAGSVVVAAAALVIFAAGLRADEDRAASPADVHQIPTFAPAGPPASVATADQLDLSAGPIQEIKAEGGRRIFQFPVAVPKGRSFSVSFNNWPRGGSSSANLVEEQERDTPSTASVQFAFTDDSKAVSRDDVLLSDEQYLAVSLNGDGCYPSGVTTIASVPIRKVPAGDRKLVLISTDSPLAKTPLGTRLLLITRKDQDPKTEAEVEKIEERGELIVSLVPQEKPKPEPTPQELMAEALRGAKSGIGTFFVRYQQLITPELKPLDADAVRKIIADAAAKDLRPNYGSSDTDADQSHQFASDVLRAMVRDDILTVVGDKPLKLGQSDFRMVGMKTLSIDGTRREETPNRIRLFDGNLDLEFDTFNHQLNVIKTGQSKFSPPQPGIDNFRSTLQLSNFRFTDPKKKLAEAGVEQLSEGRVRFKMRPIEVVATPHNGFVERLTLDRGEPGATEVFQFGPVEFTGRLTFPRSRFEFDFERGKLHSAWVVTNDEIKVNEGFRDSDFAIKLPAGTVVVDYRSNEAHPDVRKTDAEIPDAAAYIEKRDDEV